MLKNLFKRPRVQIRVLTRDPCRLTIAEWRQDVEMVKKAFTILRNRDFLLMTDVVRHNALRFAMDFGAGDHDRAISSARLEGYVNCLNDLLSLGVVEENTAEEAPSAYAVPLIDQFAEEEPENAA